MGKTNAQIVYEDLTADGLSSAGATGVVGNLVAESGVNTHSVQPDGPGRGIAQWSVGGRWDAFLAWAGGKGRDPYDLNTQVAYLEREMQSPAYGVWDALTRINDTGQAAAIVMRQYEKPRDQSDSNAARRAQLGVDAVQGAEHGLKGDVYTPINGFIDSAGGALNGPGTAVVGAAGNAWNALTGGWAADAQKLLTVGLFVALGVALVGVGLVKTASPAIGKGVRAAASVVP